METALEGQSRCLVVPIPQGNHVVNTLREAQNHQAAARRNITDPSSYDIFPELLGTILVRPRTCLLYSLAM